jgi:hypothetical protein
LITRENIHLKKTMLMFPSSCTAPREKFLWHSSANPPPSPIPSENRRQIFLAVECGVFLLVNIEEVSNPEPWKRKSADMNAVEIVFP